MRNNDEFNFVKINNDEQLGRSEFSFTPKDEVPSYNDNKSTISRDEMNDQSPSNSEHKKQEEQRRRKEDKQEEIKNESSESAQSSGGASKGGSSSASSAGGSSAASTGSAVTGTIVGAATVAVTAIAVVAGVNVITGENARIKMEEFGVQQTEMFYGLTLFTDKEDTADYRIYVTNPTYSSSQALNKGPTEPETSDWPDFDPTKDGWFNGGSFTNLTPGTRYDLSIKDTGVNGRVLYESSFVTSTKPNEAYNGVHFETPDYMNDTFTVRLDYIEEQSGYFDNFNIVISNGSNTPITQQLISTTEPQTITAEGTQSSFDLMTDSFTFTMEYTENGENKTDSGSFDFNEGGTMKSELNSITVDPSADFTNNTFDVTADFTDDFDVIDRISISFLDASGSGGGYGFQLEKGFNRVSATVDEEVMLDLTGGPYNYRIAYYLKDNLYQYPETFDEQTPVSFTDRSSSAYFSDITFSNPDYLSNAVDVQLDYTEVLEGTFQDFSLTISDGTTETTVSLGNTTEVQQVGLSHVPDFNLNEDDFIYTLTYNCAHVPGTKEGSFSFKGQAKSEFNGVTVGEYVDYDTGEFEVTLDVYNDLGLLSNFTFTLIKFDTQEEICTENLSPDRTAQTVTAPTEDVDLARGQFTYMVSYMDDGTRVTYNPNESDSDYYFTFKVSPEQEPSIELVIDEKADFVNNKLHVTLNYDDPHDLISQYMIILKIDTGDDLTHDFYLTKVNGVSQDVTLNFSLSTYSTFTYRLDYMFPGQNIITNKQSITVIDERNPTVNGLVTMSPAKVYDFNNELYIPVRIDFVDEYQMIEELYINLGSLSSDNDVLLTKSTGWQFVDVGDSYPMSIDYTLKIKKTDSSDLEEVGSGSITTGGSSSDPEMVAAWFDSYTLTTEATSNNYFCSFSYLMYETSSTNQTFNSAATLIFTGSSSGTSRQISVDLGTWTEYSTNAYSVTATISDETLITLIQSDTFAVTLEYTDYNSVTKTITLCENQTFILA